VIWSHIQSEYQQVHYLLRHIITSELVITEVRLHDKRPESLDFSSSPNRPHLDLLGLKIECSNLLHI
jgi:hypothetical protein